MSLFNDLRQRGIERGYMKHVFELEPVLQGMSRRGIPVEPVAFAEVEAMLRAIVVRTKAEMQELVPFEVKAKKVYKRTPRLNLEQCTCINGVWVRPLPWSPSNKGLIRYIKWRGHTVPKAIKTDKDTTNALELGRLAKSTGDPLYAKVLEHRKHATILDNFMENWKPGPDGMVHTTFYYDPATGQLSSRRPNVQNVPKHGPLAKTFRSVIKALPDKMLVEFDYKSFHVQTLGFEARDLNIMRMGRLDIHSFVTAHFMRLPEASKLAGIKDDKELGEYLAWVKQKYKDVRDAKAKHALLGYNNGMGYKKLYKQYMEFFNNQGEAKRIMSLLDELFPASKKYREAICQQAHEQGYLLSRHGYIRYFWEVFRWQGGKWTHGDDHEAALCFFTQNDAHGELKDRIVAFGQKGWADKYGLVDTVHDSLIFHCPKQYVDECCHEVHTVMVAPSIILVDSVSAPHGLSVGVDIQVGADWANMKGYSLA